MSILMYSVLLAHPTVPRIGCVGKPDRLGWKWVLGKASGLAILITCLGCRHESKVVPLDNPISVPVPEAERVRAVNIMTGASGVWKKADPAVQREILDWFRTNRRGNVSRAGTASEQGTKVVSAIGSIQVLYDPESEIVFEVDIGLTRLTRLVWTENRHLKADKGEYTVDAPKSSEWSKWFE